MYSASEDPVVLKILKAKNEKEALRLERLAVEQSDNGVKDTDPPQP